MLPAISLASRHLAPTAALVLPLLIPISAAAQFYNNANACITLVQTGGPFITSLGGGLFRWRVPVNVTNNTGFTLQDVHWTTQGACQGNTLAGTQNCGLIPPGDPDPSRMPWNDVLQRWDARESRFLLADQPHRHRSPSDTRIRRR